jgi:hypothetical protein
MGRAWTSEGRTPVIDVMHSALLFYLYKRYTVNLSSKRHGFVSEVAESLYVTADSTPGFVHPEFQIRSYPPTPSSPKCSDRLISKGELLKFVLLLLMGSALWRFGLGFLHRFLPLY